MDGATARGSGNEPFKSAFIARAPANRSASGLRENFHRLTGGLMLPSYTAPHDSWGENPRLRTRFSIASSTALT